jgi:hypothetical protein
MRLYLITLALATAACQMPQYSPPPAGAGDPQTTSAPTSASDPQGGSPASLGGPSTHAHGASAAQNTPVPTTVEIHSDCSKTVPVFYGEKPKFGSGTRSTVSSNSTSSQGRKADGTLTVWIIDEQENGVASVHVTPTTKRVEIDSSCKRITAR